MSWWVYIIKCSDDTFYTGITTELQRRVYEHNNTNKGAKYTRHRRPVTLVHSEPYLDRSEASKREYHIKKLSRDNKIRLIVTKTK